MTKTSSRAAEADLMVLAGIAEAYEAMAHLAAEHGAPAATIEARERAVIDRVAMGAFAEDEDAAEASRDAAQRLARFLSEARQ